MERGTGLACSSPPPPADGGGAGLLDVVETEAAVGRLGGLRRALKLVRVHRQHKGLHETWGYSTGLGTK